MLIYVYLKCSTCQNALRFLEAKKLNFDVREINLTPPSCKELETMLEHQKGNLKKILNVSGLLYRKLNLSERLKTMSHEEIFSLLSNEGMLVKRPFLLTNHIGLVGFKESEWNCASDLMNLSPFLTH